MSSSEEVDRIADKQGLSDVTVICLLCDFIEQNKTKELVPFLEERVDPGEKF